MKYRRKKGKQNILCFKYAGNQCHRSRGTRVNFGWKERIQ